MPGPGGGGGGGIAGAAPADVHVANPEQDYLQEAQYLASISALDEALSKFQNQDKAERGRYDVDYKQGLDDLGWRDMDKQTAGDQMGWDWNDVLSASGRAYQNNVNDFASRDNIQSSAYGESIDQLSRSLDRQRGSMDTGRQNFMAERDEGFANYKGQDTAARNAAKADAIARLAAGLGIV